MYVLEVTGVPPANQKNGFGVIVATEWLEEEGGSCFLVRLIYPPYLKNTTIGVLERDLIPLAQTHATDSDLILDNLSEILLSFMREIDTLKRENRFLRQAYEAL